MVTATVQPQRKPAAKPVHHSSVEGWHPKHNPWLIALTVTLATFMEVLDTSIANVALPHMAGTLGASQEEATWVLTSYLVSSAIVLPISGWLSTRFGRKRFYMTCVALFTVCSLLCGLAPTLPILILARILQGLGGGGLAPSEQAILADTFPVEQTRTGIRSLRHGSGGCAGDRTNAGRMDHRQLQLALDLLHQSAHRHHFPAAQQPHGGRPALPGERTGQGQSHRQNGPGPGGGRAWAAWSSCSIRARKKTGSATAQSRLRSCWPWSTLAFFVWWEWRHPDPIVDLKLLKNRNFGTAVGFQFILGMVLFSTTVLIPQFLQGLMGYTAERAGMALSAGALVLMVMMPVAGKLVSQMDARLMVSIGFLATSLALYNMTRLDLNVSFGHIVMWRVFQVLGLSFIFIPISTLNYVGVPAGKNNQISSFSNFARNFGGSMGTALLTTFLIAHAADPPVGAGGQFRPRQCRLREFLAQTRNALIAAGQSAAQAKAASHGIRLPAVTAAVVDAELSKCFLGAEL